MFTQLLLFTLIGFGAQLVDGAIGMAYGAINMTILLSMGIPPATASAGVHTAEVVTTGISGLSHAMFKNIDYALFVRLVIPGIVGSILGAYLLTRIPPEVSKPIIAAYLIVIGGFILYRALREGKLFHLMKNFFVGKVLKRKLPSTHARGLIPLGFGGGFFDAAGGGGWGAMVTSSLLAQGTTPHYTIGTINLTEFLVTLTTSLTFFFTIGIKHWPIIIGLIIGGAFAAPFSAYLVRRIHPRVLMLIAGTVVMLISVNILARLFF